MIIFVSALLTVGIMFGLFFAALRFQKYAKSDEMERAVGVMSAAIYNFLVFVIVAIYFIVIMRYQELNALTTALLLPVLIWGVSQLAFFMIDEKGIEVSERKLVFAVAVIEIAAVMLILACISGESEYIQYFFMDLAIIAGFFIPLEELVKKNSIGKVFKKIGEGFGYRQARKIMIFFPLFISSGIIVGTIALPAIVSEDVQNEIEFGIVCGLLGFIVILSILIQNRKSLKRLAELLCKLSVSKKSK